MSGLVRSASELPCQEGLRILLVDDDVEYGRNLEEDLEGRARLSLAVDLEHDLGAAVTRLKQGGPVDVVLLDLDLPDSKGLHTAAVVLEAAAGIPVVVLADRRNQEAAWESTRYGIQGVVLRETVTADSLLLYLRHRVSQRQLRRALERQVQDLELSQGRFLSMVVDNADGIVVVDHAGIVRFVNPSAEKLLRCSAADLLGRVFGVPLERVDVMEIDVGGRHGDAARTAEIRVIRTFWDGERTFIVTMRDITERKEIALELKLATQAAEQATAMKSQFLSTMSHGLRTPARAIAILSEITLQGVHGQIQSETCRRYLAEIQGGSRHLLALVNALFDLAKVESGRLQLAEETFDLARLAEEVVDLMAGEALTRGIRLSITLGCSSLWLQGDRQLIRQVLQGLVSNALKFTPRGGRVLVELERSELGETQIFVEDSGVGMPPEEIPRAFADFEQLECDYSRTKDCGPGLGLALCKRYVAMHQGTISLDSEPDTGTVAYVMFPPERSSSEIVTLPLRRARRGKAR